VYALLKDVSGDQDRLRLLVLRYRLVATDSLMLRWPGGLVRLAQSDPRQRQHAAEELVNLASAPDQPLLTELFSDPDPLVREISLRGLQHIGGKEANAALVKLLADPELNVRTAVLKQLEEAPDADMLPAVVKYLKTEKDPDLIVHGIRFLQESKQPEAIKCLISLLSHESWQVRSEAASGIGKLMENNNYSRGPELSNDDPQAKLQADAYMALIDLLDDSDGFVVAKAVEGLANADMAVAVDPLVKAATKHHQLALDIFSMLVNHAKMRQQAIPHIRKFCKHEVADIRAAAIGALCQAGEYDVGEEVQAALRDKESKVRIAAASGMFKTLESQRESAWQQIHQGASSGKVLSNGAGFDTTKSDLVTYYSSAIRLIFGGPAGSQPVRLLPMSDIQPPPPQPALADADSVKFDIVNPGQRVDSGGADKKVEQKEEESKTAEDEPDPWDQWLEKFYAGRQRPKWMSDAVEPLEKMLAAESVKERIAAAVTLIPLGKADEALPMLNAALRSNPEYMDMARDVLPWLTWERRLELFRYLSSLAQGEDAATELLYTMNETPDRRSADMNWELLADEKISQSKARNLQNGLMRAHLGKQFLPMSNIPASKRRELIKDAKAHIDSKSEFQRIAALILLANASNDDAAEAALRLIDDQQISESSRLDAFQILLLAEPKKDALQRAVAALEKENAERKKIALKYLVRPSVLMTLNNGFSLYSYTDSTIEVVSISGRLFVPEPPKGVEAGQIRPLLADSDPEIAAMAGYLLALMDQPDGMDALLKYWKGQPKKYNSWSRLVYRAIAALDDPKYLPVLKEIYANLEQYEMREFYWTIRIMTGPEILKFRKQIRDERGVSELQ
jgi:HEAT repeat protein